MAVVNPRNIDAGNKLVGMASASNINSVSSGADFPSVASDDSGLGTSRGVRKRTSTTVSTPSRTTTGTTATTPVATTPAATTPPVNNPISANNRNKVQSTFPDSRETMVTNPQTSTTNQQINLPTYNIQTPTNIGTVSTNSGTNPGAGTASDGGRTPTANQSGIAPGTQANVPTGGYYKVQDNGQAPVGLGVGDNVVTGGGTYEITGVNPDGTYQSRLVDKAQTTGSFTGQYANTTTRPDGVTQKAFDYRYDPRDYEKLMLGSQSQGEYNYNAQGRVNQAAAQDRDISGSGTERSNADIYQEWWKNTGSKTPVEFGGSDGKRYQGYYGMDSNGNWGYYTDPELTQKHPQGNWSLYKASDGGTAKFTTTKGYLWPDISPDPSRAGKVVTLAADSKAFQVYYDETGHVDRVVNLTGTRGIDGRSLNLPAAKAEKDTGVNGPELLQQSNGINYAGAETGVRQNELRGATPKDYWAIMGARGEQVPNDMVYGLDSETGNIYGYPSGADLNTMTFNGKSFSPVIYDRNGNIISEGGVGEGAGSSGGTGGYPGGGTGGYGGGVGGYSGGFSGGYSGGYSGGISGGTGGYPGGNTGTGGTGGTGTGGVGGVDTGNTNINVGNNNFNDLINQWYQSAQDQINNSVDYATQRGINELERAKEDAQQQYQTQRNQIAADAARARDNQALYAERRGDRGGIGAAQYDSISNTESLNQQAVNQAQTKLSTDTARQVADLRAQGEYEKADKLLQVSQSYLQQLISLQQWAAEYNLSVEQFREQVRQWEQQFELSVGEVLGSYKGQETLGSKSLALQREQLAAQQQAQAASLAMQQQQLAASLAAQQAQYTGYYNGQPTLQTLGTLAEMGLAAAQQGIQPSASQLSAMEQVYGYDASVVNALIQNAQTSQMTDQLAQQLDSYGTSGSSSSGSSSSSSSPALTYAQVRQAIKDNTMTNAVLDAYKYYQGVPYGSEGTAPAIGYASDGEAYPIGSDVGTSWLKGAVTGDTLHGRDGSDWVKNADGTVTIYKNGKVYTVR